MVGPIRGTTARLHRSGGQFRWHVLRTPLMAFVAWTSVGFAPVSVTRVSGESSIPTIEGHMAILNSSHSTETSCWKVYGLYERDCFHAEPLPSETYPLTLDMLERASSRYITTDSGLHRAFQLARRRGVLKVVAIGGSVTYGHECVSPSGLTKAKCAWSNRLKEWFDERIGYVKMEVTNAAVPAINIRIFMSDYLRDTLPVDLEVDLIIVDFGVNDGHVNKFGGGLASVILEHEALISYVSNDMIKKPAILYVETFIAPAAPGAAPRQTTNMAKVHAEVTRKHDIPMVSFRDAVWPVTEDTALAARLWGHRVHPGWQVHQLLADVLVYFIQKSHARFLEEHGLPFRPSLEEKALPLFENNMRCMEDDRSFVLDAGEFVGVPPPAQQVESVGWIFSKETGDQGGLVGFGNSSRKAVVSLDLPCGGRQRMLEMEYLKSYSGMGAVRVEVCGSDTSPGGEADMDPSATTVVIVDGLLESRASVLDYAAISIPGNAETVSVKFEVLTADTEVPYSSALSDVAGSEADGRRGTRMFKLLRMQCC